MKPSKLQHRVTRTGVKGSKLLEFGCLLQPLWIRRVLVAFGGLRLEPRRGNGRCNSTGRFSLGLALQLKPGGHCSRDRGSRRTGPEAGAVTSKIAGSPRQTPEPLRPAPSL